MKMNYIIGIALIPNYSFANSGDMSSGVSSLFLFVILFILMYFLLIRPQAKKVKEHKDLIKNLKINDEIITNGGLLGKIIKISDQFIIISLNKNINVIIKKESVIKTIPKGTIDQQIK